MTQAEGAPASRERAGMGVVGFVGVVLTLAVSDIVSFALHDQGLVVAAAARAAAAFPLAVLSTLVDALSRRKEVRRRVLLLSGAWIAGGLGVAALVEHGLLFR